jgi:hypothetical protein
MSMEEYYLEKIRDLLNDKFIQEIQESSRVNKNILEQQGKLLTAFNEVAKELRLLREELAPKKLDKPTNHLPSKD